MRGSALKAKPARSKSLLEASTAERSFAFYRSLLADGQGHVALVDGRIVGWCDIQSSFGQARAHVGVLGIGLLPDARHHGIGARLLETAIATAWSRGMTRIELTVRDDNAAARALYERFGFEHEGVQRRSMRVDGRYHDCIAMALLRRDDA
jgi:RimJ/RimL family protein N-acetyltransferase